MGAITFPAHRVVKTGFKGLTFRSQAMEGVAFDFIPGFGFDGESRRGKGSLGGNRGPLLDFQEVNRLAPKIYLLVIVERQFEASLRKVIASPFHQHGRWGT